jgi:hypothetical protein
MPDLAFQSILSTDKLQSGFRAKFNQNVLLLIKNGSISSDGSGILSLDLMNGSAIEIDLSGEMATIDYVDQAIANIAPPTTKIEIDKLQTDIVEDGAGSGNWYVEYREGASTPIPDGTLPYAITYSYNDGTNDITRSVPPSGFENNSSWAFPRIYGFPDPTTAATIEIIIYAI